LLDEYLLSNVHRSMTITHYRPHTQKKKQESYDYKLSPGGKFRILTLYLDLQK